MRKAVLITGDLRGMKWCVPSYDFLLTQSDVFVSLWDSSSVVHPYRSSLSYHSGHVTRSDILDFLRGYAVKEVILDKFNWQKHTYIYNAPLCYRWSRGMQAINQHGHYDVVTMLRPDLFFQSTTETQVPWSELDLTKVYSGWYTPNSMKLGDVIHIGSQANMTKMLITPSEWQQTYHLQKDWHMAYADIIKHKNIEVTPAFFLPRFVISRPRYPDGPLHWDDAELASKRWQKLFIDYQLSRFGIEFVRKTWGPSVVADLFPDK